MKLGYWCSFYWSAVASMSQVEEGVAIISPPDRETTLDATDRFDYPS